MRIKNMLKRLTISVILFIGYYPTYAQRGRGHDGRGPSDGSSGGGGFFSTIGTIIFWGFIAVMAFNLIKVYLESQNKDE